MKKHKSPIKLKSLNARGISHLLVPLLIVLTVAVGGTFMLVSSHANSLLPPCTAKKTTHCVKQKVTPPTGGLAGPSSTTPKTAPKAKTPGTSLTSKLLMYSNAGQFKSVKVEVAANSTAKATAAKCGVAPKGILTATYKTNIYGFSAAKNDPSTKQKVASPRIIVCNDPASGGEFRITYSTKTASKSAFSGKPVVIANQPQQCIFVHAKAPAQQHAVMNFRNGHCALAGPVAAASSATADIAASDTALANDPAAGSDAPLALDDPTLLADQ